MQDGPWAEALVRLASVHPAALAPLRRVVGALRAADGVPFEVVAGTPAQRYGARLTFRAGSDPALLARAAGVDDHPWGVPDWIGVRTTAAGTVSCKAYHRRPPPLGTSTVHRGLPVGLDPLMASLDGAALEVYGAWPGELPWVSFVAESLAPLGLTTGHEFTPVPRAARHSFAVSARHHGGELIAVSLYASTRSLPDDDILLAEWTAGMPGDERESFAQAVAAAQQLSNLGGPLFSMLAWTFDRSGFVSRAASLRVGR